MMPNQLRRDAGSRKRSRALGLLAAMICLVVAGCELPDPPPVRPGDPPRVGPSAERLVERLTGPDSATYFERVKGTLVSARGLLRSVSGGILKFEAELKNQPGKLVRVEGTPNPSGETAIPLLARRIEAGDQKVELFGLLDSWRPLEREELQSEDGQPRDMGVLLRLRDAQIKIK